MSFKEDFIEALRSVKRDFFHEQEDQAGQQVAGPLEVSKETPPTASQSGNRLDVEDQEIASANQPSAYDEDVMEAFLQASAFDDTDEDVDDEAAEERDAAPYRRYEKDYASVISHLEEEDMYENQDTDRPYVDFGGSLYDDEKTVISKNTVIRGSVETDDSVRLLGQVLGDIDCKSNIVVAGKVRGNTSAANAYIFDAQVDGDVRCDDAITISNDAWVLGNLQAQQAEIDGKIKGNIEIRHMVSIGSSSSILGNISTDELEIKRGAFVNGQIMMYSPSRDVLDRFNRFEE